MPADFPARSPAQIPPYKIGDFVPRAYRKATKVMARDIELAIVAADDAFKDAGLQSLAYTEKPNFDGTRFGCNIGAGLINTELNELTAAMTTARSESERNRLDLRRWGKDGMTQLTPLWLLKYLPNMLACHVTIIHQLKGPEQYDHLRRCQQPSGHRRSIPHDPARQRRSGHLRRRGKQSHRNGLAPSRIAQAAQRNS